MDIFNVKKEELQLYVNKLKEEVKTYQRMLVTSDGDITSDIEEFLAISIGIKENLIAKVEELIKEFK